jgi:hypothetical protein
MKIAWQVAIDRALMAWLEEDDRSRDDCRAIFEWELDCVEDGPPAYGMQSPTDERRHLWKIEAARVDVAYLVYPENHSIIAERFSSF